MMLVIREDPETLLRTKGRAQAPPNGGIPEKRKAIKRWIRGQSAPWLVVNVLQWHCLLPINFHLFINLCWDAPFSIQGGWSQVFAHQLSQAQIHRWSRRGVLWWWNVFSAETANWWNPELWMGAGGGREKSPMNSLEVRASSWDGEDSGSNPCPKCETWTWGSLTNYQAIYSPCVGSLPI